MPDAPPPNTPAPEAHETASTVIRKLGPAAILGAMWTIFPPLGSIALFTYMNTIGAWLRGHEDVGLALYVAAFAVLAGVALLPTYASAILGGWAFGFASGYPAALAGFLGGSLIGYAIARSVAKDRVSKLLHEHEKWQAVRDALVGGGFWRTLGIVSLVRVPPNSPFALTNLALAGSGVAILPYALGTLIGMAPRTGIVLYIASKVRASLAADAAKEVAEQRPAWLIPVSIAASLVVLGVLGLIAKHALKRFTRVPGRGPSPAASAGG